jgi:biopolymer transport protein ExbD
MLRPPYHRDARGRLDVKMTPMIDVIFLLLIFFICTASFRPPEETLPTRMSLPGAVDSRLPVDPELIDLDEIVVKVMWRERKVAWQINDVDYRTLAEVRDVLEAARQLKPDLPVILDVEPSVPMENVIDVYDVCRQVGLERVQFAASVTTTDA